MSNENTRPRWVLDADIKGFFDNISHDWLRKNIPVEPRILKSWLKAGALDQGNLIETKAGVPQGSPISPTLANRTLDGLEKCVEDQIEHLRGYKTRRKGMKSKKWSPKMWVFRYADDFVVTGATRRLVESVRPGINEFLKRRGLELNLTKTKVVSLKEGINFVGFNFRLYSDRKRGKSVALTKPTAKGIRRLTMKIREEFGQKNKSARRILMALNPILRGWANYYRTVVSKRVFTGRGNYLWESSWRWARKKHPQVAHKELAARYYKKVGNRSWVFHGTEAGKADLELFNIAGVPIKRHRFLKEQRNPYTEDGAEYFGKRGKTSVTDPWVTGTRKAKLLKAQSSTCPVCEQPIGVREVNWMVEDNEVHHIVPVAEGGNSTLKNLVVLHKECHKQVTYTKDKRLLARFACKNILGSREAKEALATVSKKTQE